MLSREVNHVLVDCTARVRLMTFSHTTGLLHVHNVLITVMSKEPILRPIAHHTLAAEVQRRYICTFWMNTSHARAPPLLYNNELHAFTLPWFGPHRSV